METTVGHQLARAKTVTTVLPAASVVVLPVAKRIALALERAYKDKRVAVELPSDAAPQSALAVRVDERDLMEMLGNVIENAFKYTRTRVRINVYATERGVAASVDDDGAGISPDNRDLVLLRGYTRRHRRERPRHRPCSGGGTGQPLRGPTDDWRQRSGGSGGVRGVAGAGRRQPAP